MDAMTPPAMLQPQMAAPPMQAPPVQPTHDVTIVTTKKLAQARVMGVPPEEFGIERGARTIADCNYCFHEVVTKTEAQLISEGFDKEDVKGLASYDGNTEVETLTRDSVQEHYFTTGADSTNSAARLVRITEHYIRMDYQGNGRPCLYQVITGGERGQILKRDGKPAITQFDAIPFAATTPVPITHRFFGRSIADLVMPAQREKTALKRGALDNLYLITNPRVVVPESAAGPNTLDDLLVSRPGGIVRTKGEGLEWQVTPDVTRSVYPMLSYIDSELEVRTGVTRQGQGIDANALQNQTATAVAQVFSASQMRMKLIARIMSEGVRDIFSLLHGTIRKHGQEVQTVRLRNKWIPVDPRQWKSRSDMTINVGLGNGGKAQQFAQTMAIANVQKEMIAGGKVNLVGDKELYNTASELTRIMGHKNPDKFFNDPDAKDPNTGQLMHPPVQPPPDPKVLAIQAQAQNDQQELAMKAQLDKQKVQDAAQLAQFKAEIDAKLKMIDAHMKALEMDRKAHADQQAHHAKVAETVVDVVADAQKHDMAMAHEQQAHEMKLEQADQSHQAKLEQMKNAPKPKAGK